MPLLTLLITPLLSLYLKFDVAKYAIRFILFGVVFALFKSAMQFIINAVFSEMSVIQMPCMATYILNELDVFPMLNFGLSLWGTIYIGRYLLNSMMKLV